MSLVPIKLDRVSFETKGRHSLQKTADFLIKSIVLCPLVPPSWISLVDPTELYLGAVHMSRASPANRADAILSRPVVA